MIQGISEIFYTSATYAVVHKELYVRPIENIVEGVM